ncbi:hypothetical protein F6X40_11205 [Paraburkholderia sp. UCT31]|uniref:hypothetical protein n=1 Tax=Paraburkholderia sp. UCT31 TaxID=2615209 RepID=UPI001655B8AF|nr:hypothetical protein [Paraburkholderia sp. UCT31]MBC8737371.1 hypothetical protein [Paraburkholderia sp. UCT31]
MSRVLTPAYGSNSSEVTGYIEAAWRIAEELGAQDALDGAPMPSAFETEPILRGGWKCGAASRQGAAL